MMVRADLEALAPAPSVGDADLYSPPLCRRLYAIPTSAASSASAATSRSPAPEADQRGVLTERVGIAPSVRARRGGVGFAGESGPDEVQRASVRPERPGQAEVSRSVPPSAGGAVANSENTAGVPSGRGYEPAPARQSGRLVRGHLLLGRHRAAGGAPGGAGCGARTPPRAPAGRRRRHVEGVPARGAAPGPPGRLLMDEAELRETILGDGLIWATASPLQLAASSPVVEEEGPHVWTSVHLLLVKPLYH